MFYLQILTTHQAIQMLLYQNQKTFSLLHWLSIKNVFPNLKRLFRTLYQSPTCSVT